ncbi:flavin reductase (DIM6/NTAB) family NADH-FMN oxidoreductase RutF [Alkalibacillus filiformis]|uniref:Flavin reductase (DIM6/NTAB) family NADH-FMN oxidoreductase RutF n=1 Tax=Alkalibacillus filiformis TaxID=200990 RepID=A0ABU0DT06_9BACI|nr:MULTISPECIES: flavin reductase family protein [Alkalibacillus]MDQ0351577.1 flavin reductase (DIM6/NTAB) family NADH-FMN oxidoreductase RutF [Alkalibacillus filiformis]MDV2582420.1 flavin reductase family protein [Alkalibacillus haloalkaliphilus]
MDSRTFRDAMGRFATGVTVVTTQVDDETHGMTANAFMSVSLDPKLVTISIDHNAKMYSRIKQSQQFAVSILSDEQMDVSMHFAGQKDNPAAVQFDFVSGIPVIRDALTAVVCNVIESYEVGDHTLFIGEVLEIKLTDGNPLAFFGGKYGSYQPV